MWPTLTDNYTSHCKNWSIIFCISLWESVSILTLVSFYFIPENLTTQNRPKTSNQLPTNTIIPTKLGFTNSQYYSNLHLSVWGATFWQVINWRNWRTTRRWIDSKRNTIFSQMNFMTGQVSSQNGQTIFFSGSHRSVRQHYKLHLLVHSLILLLYHMSTLILGKF